MNAYEMAKAEVGTVEWANGNNPKVVAYFKDSGNPGVMDDETAWCAAFVGAMLKRAGIKGTGKLNARSYLDWGTPVARKDAQPDKTSISQGLAPRRGRAYREIFQLVREQMEAGDE